MHKMRMLISSAEHIRLMHNHHGNMGVPVPDHFQRHAPSLQRAVGHGATVSMPNNTRNGGTGMYPQNDTVILKTLLALPAVSFAKSPRMDFLHKKSVAGARGGLCRAVGSADAPTHRRESLH